VSITKAERLADKKRVAFGLTRDQFRKWLRNRLLAGFGQQFLELAG
jgi:hypothetical protein